MLFHISLLIVFSLCLGDSEDPAPVVCTPLGRLKGKYIQTRDNRTVMGFLGIPYAKPPIGPLRFQPPQPAEPWLDERLAVDQPKACAQPIDPTSTEDCLYLNVYTPDTSRRARLPVFVQVYGGGFEISGIAGYTPEYFLDEDIILIGIQHRLGLFGFLSTGDAVVPGNMGLKDVRLGLRWVQQYVRYFGGDPRKVTIGGESAGSVIIHYFMTFMAHTGLFRAGISQSGTALCTWAFHPPVEIHKMVVKLASLSGCPSDSVGFVNCLMAMSTEDIVELYSVKYKGAVYYGIEDVIMFELPLIGGVLEPDSVEDRIVSGNPWDYRTTVPWLVGVNSKEALFGFKAQEVDETGAVFLYTDSVFDFYFPLGLNYENSLYNGTPVTRDARAFYLKGLPISKLTLSPFIDLVSDGLIVYPTFAAVLRANKVKTYLYFFDHVGSYEIPETLPDSRIGAAHTDELFYFFPHPAIPIPIQPIPNAEEERFSKALVKLWTNFITCMDPAPCKTCDVQWNPFFPNHRYLHMTQTGFKMEDHFLEDRMWFWESHDFPFRGEDVVPPCRNNNETCLDIFAAKTGSS